MNEQEFSQKVMIYSSKFYGYSYKLLGSQDEARDAVQDLYLKLWSMRSSLSGIGNIEAFATTIIRNLCIDKINRNRRSLMYKERIVNQSKDSDINDVEFINDQNFKIELVREAIRLLPEIQQKVFIMRDFEENEFEDIAIEIGVSPENVRVILSRARKKLRELVEKHIYR